MDMIEQKMMEEVGRLVALHLWRLEAIKVNLEKPFRLASGNYSPIYVNCRQLISSPAFADLFAAAARMICEFNKLAFDVIAGGETAGIPFAAFLARSLGKPMIYIRKAKKDHGIASRIEGSLHSGQRVLLVEDLITDAGSKLSFIDAIKEVGGTVKDVIVIFDRLQGGEAALKSIGIDLYSITNIGTFLSIAEEHDLFSATHLAEIGKYLFDPGQWHQERSYPFKGD